MSADLPDGCGEPHCVLPPRGDVYCNANGTWQGYPCKHCKRPAAPASPAKESSPFLEQLQELQADPHSIRGIPDEATEAALWGRVPAKEATRESPAGSMSLGMHYYDAAKGRLVKVEATEATREGETPETDNHEYDCDSSAALGGTLPHPEMVVPSDFARKLELSRNAAERRAADAVERMHAKNDRINELATQLAAAESEREALRADKARLDWLEKRSVDVFGNGESTDSAIMLGISGKDLRAAIDQALAPASETTAAES